MEDVRFLLHSSETSVKEEKSLKTEGNSSSALTTGDFEPTTMIPTLPTTISGPQLTSAIFGYDLEIIKQRPWRTPNANVDAYFNYGFNEISWAAYVASQKMTGDKSLLSQTLTQLQLEGVEVANLPGHAVAMQYMGNAPTGNYKVKMCKMFLEGSCRYGHNCYYAHHESELGPSYAPQPPTVQGAASGGVAVPSPMPTTYGGAPPGWQYGGGMAPPSGSYGYYPSGAVPPPPYAGVSSAYLKKRGREDGYH